MKLRDLRNLSKLKPIGVPEKNGLCIGVLIGLVLCIPIWGLIFYFVF